LAVIFFEFFLVVSGLRIFQQVCFLYSNKLLQANLPVTHESTLQKTNHTSSSGVPRVYRAWGQNQFKRSPARSWQHKIKETLQSSGLLTIITFQGQSFLAFAAENSSIILSKS